MSLLPLGEARRIIASSLGPLPPRSLPLARALGCVLAESVRAERDLPPFDNSAMDGFAFRRADLLDASPEHPVELPVARFVPAGDAGDFELPEGAAAKVMTGAPVPRGADGVIPVEEAEEDEDRVRVTRAVRPGENVRPRGDDVRAGEVVLEPGCVIDAARLGILASAGRPEANVRPTPRVAVLSTGDELVEPGEEPGPGRIVDSNRFAVAGLLREQGFEVDEITRASDEPEDLRGKLEGALTRDALVTIGGVSKGDRDNVIAVLEDLGVSIQFHGVGVKPGKPFAFGLREGRPVFCLPGNPVSSYVTAFLLAVPGIRVLAGREPGLLPLERALLESDLPNRPGRMRLAPAVARRSRGALRVAPLPKRGSHQFSAVAACDGWVVLPGDSTGASEGDAVSFLPRRAPGAERLPFFLSIVGSRDHGKTRYVEELIRLLTERGYRVGTIKHSRHDHEIDKEGKDSWRHRMAGAIRAGIVNAGGGAVFLDAGERDLVPRLFGGFDVVLIEGGSHLADLVVEVWKAGGEPPRYLDHPRLLAVVTDGPVETSVPVLSPGRAESLLDLLARSRLLPRIS